jgi:succinate dehydrogenase hydrophobic anchor subunit
MTASATLFAAGAICLALSGFMLYYTMPRDGRPPTAWTRTETRAMSTAMLFLLLFFSGIIMMLKGIF